MKKWTLLAVAAALAAGSLQARAIIVLANNTACVDGVSDGASLPNDQLYIAYSVDEISSGLYFYNYDLWTVVPEDLTSFTIGGATDPIDTTGLTMLNYGRAEAAASGYSDDSVGWDWGFNSGVTGDDVSFLSNVAPGYASFTANDDDIAWSSPALLAAPVPEPSSFAILLASALAFCLFKDRRRIRAIH